MSPHLEERLELLEVMRNPATVCNVMMTTVTMVAIRTLMMTVMMMTMMTTILLQASIASYPEEMGEGRRHNKRSARMDEQVKS